MKISELEIIDVDVNQEVEIRIVVKINKYDVINRQKFGPTIDVKRIMAERMAEEITKELEKGERFKGGVLDVLE